MKNLILIFLMLSGLTTAQQILTVNKVLDGDTFQAHGVRYRIAEIDAPELSQVYGKRSKVYLSKLILGKQVRVYKINTDHYGRVVVRVYINNQNVSEIMVKSGQAWVYIRYNRNPRLPMLQNYAQNNKNGLWKYHSIPPSKYRQSK